MSDSYITPEEAEDYLAARDADTRPLAEQLAELPAELRELAERLVDRHFQFVDDDGQPASASPSSRTPRS
jgi:hypothetical protein